jgi:hypothetical protein
MSFFASRVCIRCQNDEVDSGLWSSEFQDLLKVWSHVIPPTWRGRLKAELESNHTVAAVIGNPQGVDSRVVICVTEHFRVVGETTDELDSGKDVVAFIRKKLKDSALLAANDNTTIDKRDGRGRIITTNDRRPEGLPVANIPKAESRIIGDCGNGRVTNVKFESNEWLKLHLSQSTQNEKKS